MNNNNGAGAPVGHSSSNLEKYLLSNTKSMKDYFVLFRNNLKYILIISTASVILATAYALISKSIYTSTASVRITNPYKNVLENGRQNQDNTFLDRYIVSELGVIGNYSTRLKIAKSLVDSFEVSPYKDKLPLLSQGKGSASPKSVEQVAGLIGGVIAAEQNQGTDVVSISAGSGSPIEAALIANCAAKEYQKINTYVSREKLTSLREFLEEQAKEKLAELRSVEDSMKKYQEKGGIISFDVQSSNVIGQLSNLNAQKEAVKIDLATSNEVLKQYKFFLKQKDPQLVEYLESQTSQTYINSLQQQLAELQVNRDLATSISNPGVDITAKIQEYDKKIADVKQKLNATIGAIKVDAYSGNPEQVRDLAQRMVDEEIRNSTLTVQLQQLEAATGKYEGNLRKLPEASTVLSQYQRERESLQATYLMLNEKFQEAMINEASESGNVVILNPAVIPDKPSKPNRLFIILVGFILGPIISLALIIVKDQFDDSIKTPDDIEKEEISFLTWVPHLSSNEKGNGRLGLMVLDDEDTPIKESFRVIKTRVQQSNLLPESFKVILVTSPAEGEGKSFVSSNLAASFAQSNKKTLLIDCDLRRPTVHLTLGVDKKPGLSDYLFRKVKLQDIIRKTQHSNFNFITSGTIPSNPAEIFESKAFHNFLKEIKDYFEVVILDSPPIIAVVDSEIIAKQVDGTILVIGADKTVKRLMKDAVDLLKRNKIPFLGTILNNFKQKSGYNYYYKYNYSYNRNGNQKSKRSFKVKS